MDDVSPTQGGFQPEPIPPEAPCQGDGFRVDGRRVDGRRAAAWPLWLLALLPTLGFLLVVLAPPLNHDVAAILAFSGRWLGGEGLYTDLIDVNPPLIFVLSAVPAAIGAHTPLGPVAALQLCLLALCALSVWLALRVAPWRAGTDPVAAAGLVATLPLVMLAAGYEFAQREHIMVVAALPYLLLAARRAGDGEGSPGVPWTLGCGVVLLAALGFALKPYFLVIPALVEALVLARRGPARALRDPVPWTMAAAWLAYLASILWLFPAYPAQVLPLIRAYYLGLGDVAWWQVALSERLGTALFLLVPLGLLAFLPAGPGRRPQFGALAQVLALAAAGAALSAIVQAKGWDYHALPARLFTGLLAVVVAARWLDAALPAARARRAAPATAAVLAFGLAAFQVIGSAAPWREIRWATSDGGALTEVVERVAAGQPVLVLSPYIDPIFQALAYAGAHSTLPTMTIWPLQGAYGAGRACPPGAARYRTPAEMPPGEGLLWREVAQDFARAPPAAVLVALNPRIANCGRGFDLIEYFARHPLFAGTLRRYRPGPVVAGHRIYTRVE